VQRTWQHAPAMCLQCSEPKCDEPIQQSQNESNSPPDERPVIPPRSSSSLSAASDGAGGALCWKKSGRPSRGTSNPSPNVRASRSSSSSSAPPRSSAGAPRKKSGRPSRPPPPGPVWQTQSQRLKAPRKNRAGRHDATHHHRQMTWHYHPNKQRYKIEPARLPRAGRRKSENEREKYSARLNLTVNLGT
jgi:hypothetical protein